MPSQSCRFYEAQFPDVEQAVMVNVNKVAEMGAYVSLLEYNNTEVRARVSGWLRRAPSVLASPFCALQTSLFSRWMCFLLHALYLISPLDPKYRHFALFYHRLFIPVP